MEKTFEWMFLERIKEKKYCVQIARQSRKYKNIPELAPLQNCKVKTASPVPTAARKSSGCF